MARRVVWILGAGFSMPLDGPSEGAAGGVLAGAIRDVGAHALDGEAAEDADVDPAVVVAVDDHVERVGLGVGAQDLVVEVLERGTRLG
jgi:hypothetical protein